MVIEIKDFRYAIRKLRGEKSKSLFALEYGVSRQAVERWERGDCLPRESALREMGVRLALVTQNVRGEKL